ncbi:MAG: phosphohistidine phosphatase SixA [Vicinamibacterales bacterium]
MSRLVYLVRHGLADAKGSAYPDDSKRPLTQEGKDRLHEVGRGLVALGVTVESVLTSPFVRARQTAEILAASWPKAPGVTDLSALAVGGAIADVCAALATRGGSQHLALVGHMPGLGELASELLGMAQPVDFKKGAVLCLELNRTPARGAATLRWLATPRMLRRIK